MSYHTLHIPRATVALFLTLLALIPLCPAPAGATSASQLKLEVLTPREGEKLELCYSQTVTVSVQVTVTGGKSPAGTVVTVWGAGDTAEKTVGASGRATLTVRLRQEGEQVLQVSATHPQYGDSVTIPRPVSVVPCSYEVTMDYTGFYKALVGDEWLYFVDTVRAHTSFELGREPLRHIHYFGRLWAAVTTNVLTRGQVRTTCTLTPADLPYFDGEMQAGILGDTLAIVFVPWPEPVTLWEGQSPVLKCHTLDPTKTVDWEAYTPMPSTFDMVSQFSLKEGFSVDIGGGEVLFTSSKLAVWSFSKTTYLAVRVKRLKPGQ